MEIVKLNFNGPLHLALGRADYSESQPGLRSDTLKAALFSAARLLFEEEVLMGQTDENCPFLDAFTVSSAFPFFGKEFFFPIPKTGLPNNDPDLRKALKNIRYVGRSVFEKLIHNETFLPKKEHLWQKNVFFTEADLWPVPGHTPTNLERQEFRLTHSMVYQHVMVPRDSGDDGDTFYMERIFFPPGSGLYFFIQFDVQQFPDIRNAVAAALRLLGDEGLGSDRSTGNGSFRFEGFEDLALRLPSDQDATGQLNLSLYCPATAEFSDNLVLNSAYSLIRRGGYVASPVDFSNASLRKQPLYFFEEGSLFPANAGRLHGKLVNVRPGKMDGHHPVWRDGRSIFLPVKTAVNV